MLKSYQLKVALKVAFFDQIYYVQRTLSSSVFGNWMSQKTKADSWQALGKPK